jgi:hypothetical protein
MLDKGMAFSMTVQQSHTRRALKHFILPRVIIIIIIIIIMKNFAQDVTLLVYIRRCPDATPSFLIEVSQNFPLSLQTNYEIICAPNRPQPLSIKSVPTEHSPVTLSCNVLQSEVLDSVVK